ncbi:sulfurtransferase [Mycobacterium sp. C31M]
MTAAAIDADRLVIVAEKLRRKREAGRDVVVLEIWRDGRREGLGRIPGARAVALTTDLVGAASASAGNLPLPTADQIQDVVRRWGIHAESIVVVYSPENPALAARAWWTLTWAGVPDVRVLDGGVDEWVAAGGELADDEPAVDAGTFTVSTGALPTLDTEQAAALARSGVLVDARGSDAYRGSTGGGHIPGARSLPAGDLVADRSRLLGDDGLRSALSAVGADGTRSIGAYCGGGTSATLTVLALAKLGITAALYPGSFSAYGSDPARPVAAGDEPG